MNTKKINQSELLRALILTIICIIVNLLGKSIALYFNLPFYLDMIGTVVVTYFAGPVWVIIAGVGTDIIFGILYGYKCMIFAITAIVLVYAICILKKYNFFDKFKTALVSSFWLGIVCLLVSLPLCMLVYGGKVGNVWGDALYEMLRWRSVPGVLCSIAGSAIIEIVDKQVVVIISFSIISLLKKLEKNYRKNRRKKRIVKKSAKKTTKITTAIFILVTVLGCLSQQGFDTKAFENDNFEGEIYNNKNGMMSSEANAIGETEDGVIWIGNYAGLTRYDGNNFEFVREGGISNVNALFTDSKGRLWIGTNDAGVYRYQNEEYIMFDINDGLDSDIIRSFTEDEDGNIYVGTSEGICVFDEEDIISVISCEGSDAINNIMDMVFMQGMLCGVTGDGTVFAVDNREGEYKLWSKSDEELQYFSIAKTTSGLLLGGSDGVIYRLNLNDENKTIEKWMNTYTGEVNSMLEASNGFIWICSESSYGYIGLDSKYHDKTQKGFDSFLYNIHEDYQGNIWIASSRYGVIKLYASQFVDMFSKVGVEGCTVNAVTKYDGHLYCATDDGLYVINLRSNSLLFNDLTKLLEGVRVRCLMVDSDNQLWIGTYGDIGLICWDGESILDTYNMNDDGTTSNKIRCLCELSDKTIAVGTADGLNFIKDGQVKATITAADGLKNTQILCLDESEDGTLYVGSDGAGIYTVQNYAITGNYNKDDGLSAGIILRMVPYNDGYIVVTSNSLCYMEENGIRKLENFPYFNNYDVIINGDFAYITSSAGLYVTKVKDVCDDIIDIQYILYDVDKGLKNAFTANSWNYTEDDGSIYLCTNNGVFHFDEERKIGLDRYKYGVTHVVCDGINIEPDGNNYIVPAEAKNITVMGAVNNYSMEDVRVRFYAEGFGRENEIYKFKDLEPINLYNLSAGSYKVCFEILDGQSEKVIQSKIFIITKQAHLWETTVFKIYLGIVLIELLIFTFWTIIVTVSYIKGRTVKEEMYRENEEKLTAQVKEKTKELEQKKDEASNLLGQTILALSSAVDAKDRYTSGHSKRVAEYARAIARHMGKGEEEVLEIYYAGLLHDIGKIRVPDGIINKPGKLTDEEFNYIKLHPVAGHHILKEISGNRRFSEGARFHHERFDGKGYPNGLVGKNIPEIARIIGVADAYDAMASDRSYRKALPQDFIREEIVKGKGTQFDPDIADVMLKLMDEDKDYNMRQIEGNDKNILVVDDAPMNIKMVEFALKDETGYNIHKANSGMEALTKLEEESIDLVLLDIEMPEMDGFETLEQIQKIKDVPVVFMTADKDIETIERAEALGVEDYLTKPFLPMALKEIVHSILNG